MKLKMHLEYKWQDLLNKKGEQYFFPDARSTLQRNILEAAGIYRWLMINGRTQNVTLYIGETSNIYNRLYGYLHRSKSQATSYRVGNKLRRIVKKNGRIKLQLLFLSKSRFGSRWISNHNHNLCCVHIRKAIEQTLIYHEKNSGGCSLNGEK